MSWNNKTQYRGNYQNQNYSSQYRGHSVNYNKRSDNSRGSAKFVSTKKDGCLLTVELKDQNLVLKGYYSSKGVGKDGGGGWRLYPYYDKTKPTPNYSNPPRQTVQRDPMDDQMPNDTKDDGTDFDPNELEQQGKDESDQRR